MEFREVSGVGFYVFPEIERLGTVIHGFTGRWGGVSSGPYSTLNLAYHVGDDPCRVAMNRSRTLEALGFSGDGWAGALVAGEQVHGDGIAFVTPPDRGREGSPAAPALPRTDGLVTDYDRMVLSAYFADCVPIYLVDPVRPAIGLVHAGWRGTALGIARKAVAAMVEAFGTEPRNLHAGIGPSIGACCYTVGPEVAFDVARASLCSVDEIALGVGSGCKRRLDLKAANRLQLEGAGIPSSNIYVSELCTCCRQDLFFSHRGSGGPTGRMGAFLGLRR